MARIAFFTERLPPDHDPITRFSYDLVCSLAEQQHDMRVFSTYFQGAEMPPARARVEIVRPFRNWSWLEVPRAIPVLLEFRPDVLHFVQPRAETLQGMTNALTAIHGINPLLGRPAVVSTFYDLSRENLREQQLLLLASDAVTVMNAPQENLVQEFFEANQHKTKNRKQRITAILPAPSSSDRWALSSSDSAMDESEIPETLRQFTKSDAPIEGGRDAADFIFVPGSVSDHLETASLFEALASTLESFPKVKVVFGGGWGAISPRNRHDLMRAFESRSAGARVFLTGPLSPATQRFCLENARLVFTASLPPESLQLTRLLRDALETSAALVLSRPQAELDPLPWKDHEHAFIAEMQSSTWSKVLNEALSSDELVDMIRRQLPEFTRSEAVDHPGNIISRVYSRVLARKST